MARSRGGSGGGGIVGTILGVLVGVVFGWVVVVAVPLIDELSIPVGTLVVYVVVATLAGLLAFRGVVWNMSQGEGVFGIDETFRKLGGGYRGSVGGDTTDRSSSSTARSPFDTRNARAHSVSAGSGNVGSCAVTSRTRFARSGTPSGSIAQPPAASSCHHQSTPSTEN